MRIHPWSLIFCGLASVASLLSSSLASAAPEKGVESSATNPAAAPSGVGAVSGAGVVILATHYPQRAVHVAVPFAPGGGIDSVARMFAQRLQELTAQPFVVENRAGGGGTVGSDWVAKSKADGYTLLAVPISHAANVSQGKLPFDPQKDFSPIIEIASAPNVVLVNPSLGVKDLNAFIALAKENKGQLSYASSGNGSSTHLAGQLMMMSAHIDLLHVPYKGGGPALIDLLGSQVNMYIASIPASIPHLQNQKLVALAVTSSTRTPALPNVPTAMELGLSDFEYLGWYGLLAPKSTPKVVVSKLNALVNQILKEPAVIEKLSQEGATPVGGSSEQFSKFIASEVAKWAKVAQYVKDQPS